jgi:hypothetical protein
MKKRQTSDSPPADSNQQPSQDNSNPSNSNSNNNNNSNSDSNNSNNGSSDPNSDSSSSVTSQPTPTSTSTSTSSSSSTSTQLPSLPETDHPQSSTYNPASTIVVGIITGVIALGVFIALVYLCWRSNKKRRHNYKFEGSGYREKNIVFGRNPHTYDPIISIETTAPTPREARESLVVQKIPHGQVGSISSGQAIKPHRASLVIQSGGQQHIDMSNLEAYVQEFDDKPHPELHQSENNPPTSPPGMDALDDSRLSPKSSLKRSERSILRKSRDKSRESNREELRKTLIRGKSNPVERGRRRGNSVSTNEAVTTRELNIREDRTSLSSDPGSQYNTPYTVPHSLSAGSSPMITAQRMPPRSGEEETSTPPYENAESMTPLPLPTRQQSRGRSRSRSPLPPSSGARIQKEEN